MRATLVQTFSVSGLLFVLVTGCGARTGLPEEERDGGPDTAVPDTSLPDTGVDTFVPPDTTPPEDTALPDTAEPDTGPRPCRRPAAVDLLLVVDDSGSMQEEQNNLARELPLLVNRLIDPPDEDGDGRRDWRAVQDLHMGVVSTSLNGTPFCERTAPDDGVLRDFSGDPMCARRYPRFLDYNRDDGDDAEAISQDFGCVARTGIEGCPFEQPLEAAIKALLPRGEFDFVEGDAHGDRENRGFLREDSLLAVIILTDEDDCSAEDPELYFEPFERGTLPPCLQEDDPLFPVDRYEEAFRSLRPSRPDLFTLAVIGGVPPIVVPDPLDIDFERVLEHPRMIYRIDPREPLLGVVPACTGRGGSGFPARRIVQVAERFGRQATVGSICDESYSPIVEAIARQVGTRACEEFE